MLTICLLESNHLPNMTRGLVLTLIFVPNYHLYLYFQVADELVKELTESEKKSAQMVGVVSSHCQLVVTLYLQTSP